MQMFSLSPKAEKIKDTKTVEDERLHSLVKIFSTKEDEWLIRKYICNMLVSSINYEHKKTIHSFRNICSSVSTV